MDLILDMNENDNLSWGFLVRKQHSKSFEVNIERQYSVHHDYNDNRSFSCPTEINFPNSQYVDYKKNNLFYYQYLTFDIFSSIIRKYAIALTSGIIVALIIANIDYLKYDFWFGNEKNHSEKNIIKSYKNHPLFFDLIINDHELTINFIVNEILMCFFFGLAVKEIVEALRFGGSLYPINYNILNPIFATLGGIIVPIAIYFFLIICFEDNIGFPRNETYVGWGIPVATDISIAWITSIFVFGRNHPAINYLLILAIFDDGIGMLIIAIFYNEGCPDWKYLGLVIIAMMINYLLSKIKVRSWVLYIFIAGPISWLGFQFSNLHPALALVPIIVFIPSKIEYYPKKNFINQQIGNENETLIDESIKIGPETIYVLENFEKSIAPFVDIFVLFSFGLTNAGVKVNEMSIYSIIILLSLVIGKTIGITLFSIFSSFILRSKLPNGIDHKKLIMISFIASIGLTVSLFISGEAFPDNEKLESQAKFGSLLSIFISPIAILIGRLLL